MEPLFTPSGDAALAALMRRAPLLAFDFDGTLAPIVERPDDARAAADVSQHLGELARRFPLAIITGRAVADVVPRLGFAPRYVVGSHGAEDPSRPDVAEGAAASAPALAALAALRERLRHDPALPASGVQVEDKGRSIALHYRLAADPAAAVAVIEEALAGLDDALATFGGKCVVNVVDAAASDKGDALVALLARSGADAAFFIGDDVNDETVFERAEPGWLTVRVGRDPVSCAMYFVERQSDVAALLSRMLALAMD